MRDTVASQLSTRTGKDTMQTGNGVKSEQYSNLNE